MKLFALFTNAHESELQRRCPVRRRERRLRVHRLLGAARGGSLLLTNVEEISAFGQESLTETLAELRGARDPLAAVRQIAGTTVILRDCVAAGTFSERLFYRLNVIHIVVPGGFAPRDTFGAGMSTGTE